MCGIFGYIGRRGSVQMLVDGLKRLEYRGYDSAGVVYMNGQGLEIHKTRGKLKDLMDILPDRSRCLQVGLGHTRWATHGAPSTVNAHPHCAGGIAVVHNGIIENYRELRSWLEGEGHIFCSETDTEVVPQLIARFRNQGLSLKEAIQESMARMRGSFALGIMGDDTEARLFAVRSGSPLVVGINADEYFIASDIPAILPHTNRFIFMDDGQICELSRQRIAFCCFDGSAMANAASTVVEVDWTPSMAEKNGHDHFMLKEICEQPLAIRNTIGEWSDSLLNLCDEIGIGKGRAEAIDRMHIVACGTSYHAGLVARHVIERLAGIPVEVDIASEYRYRNPLVGPDTLFLSITQSGETADTLAAQREAKKRGARTLTISNVVGSTAARESDSVLYTRAGPEIGVAATKTFAAQMAALYLFALSLGTRKGGPAAIGAQDLRDRLLEIPARVEEALGVDRQIIRLAETLVTETNVLFLGRGLSYPLALEGALKLKEISYIHAEGCAAGEMKHGTIALIDEGSTVIVLAPGDHVLTKVLANIEEVIARGGRVIAITDAQGALAQKTHDVIQVPASPHPMLTPFLSIIPLQLLAYHVGVLRGCDVDQPRNLAKSVTVE